MAALAAVIIVVIIIIITIIVISREKVVDLVARNLKEPKGLAGYFVRVSWCTRFLVRERLSCWTVPTKYRSIFLRGL